MNKLATFAGGCFWCMVKPFDQYEGVRKVVSGYTGGHTENPTYEELKEWHSISGLPLKKFFNTSGLLYKSMKLKDKLPEMGEEEQLKLLATDGMLVKRPILIGETKVLVGFKESEWSENV